MAPQGTYVRPVLVLSFGLAMLLTFLSVLTISRIGSIGKFALAVSTTLLILSIFGYTLVLWWEIKESSCGATARTVDSDDGCHSIMLPEGAGSPQIRAREDVNIWVDSLHLPINTSTSSGASSAEPSSSCLPVDSCPTSETPRPSSVTIGPCSAIPSVSTGRALSLEKLYGLRQYSWADLTKATKNFNNVLGEGAFGKVFLARFPDGALGAAKIEVLHYEKGVLDEVFYQEVSVLARVHHSNVIKLIGVCLDPDKPRVLLFEYMGNGSLYQNLHKRHTLQPEKQVELLSWKMRMTIAYQVACSLQYLHKHANPPIVHRDVKSANILLDKKYSAKLADFGMAKASEHDFSSFKSVETLSAGGSRGYIDPYYVNTGDLSQKCDVYSFGVLLLELMTGRKAFFERTTLVQWAAPYLKEIDPRMMEIVDSKVVCTADVEQVLGAASIVRDCLKYEQKARPSMHEVVDKIRRISKDLASPA